LYHICRGLIGCLTVPGPSAVPNIQLKMGLSARMSKIKNDGLDQYGAGPFTQQQFRTAGVEWVNRRRRVKIERLLLVTGVGDLNSLARQTGSQ